MVTQYKPGDRVKYHAVGTATAGTATSVTTGEIVNVITGTHTVGETGLSVKASAEEPRYLIRNDNTHKETTYKADNIVEKIE